MRYLLILSLLVFSLFAKEQEACYSVQLASFYKSKSGYFNINKYPESCELVNIANMKAVRCGCFTEKKEAVSELKILRSLYRSSVLVRTYKSRFKNLNKIQTPVTEDTPIQNETVMMEEASKSIDKDTSTNTEEQTETTQVQEVPSFQDMKNFIEEGTFDFRGHVDLTAQGYIDRPDGKHKANLTAATTLEGEFRKDDLTIAATLYAQQDYYDFKGSSDQNDRSFVRLDELYGKYDFEDSQIMAGKSIRFWGALELRNVVDVFNVQDLRNDPFETDKLGEWNAAYTYYTDSGEISLIVKLNEQDRQMSNFPYVYYYFPEQNQFGQDISYDDNLKTEESRNRPTVYLKYSGSTDTDYALDYTVILQNGYDSQRYFKADRYGKFQENAYIVNKLMTFNTLVVGSTLVKFEGTYANIKNSQSIPTASGQVKSISDYYHIGLGLEHTLTQFHNEADLGLIAEYYKYETIDSGDKYLNDLEVFEAMQNDLFLGFRYSFNEGNDASIVSGMILDLDYDEQVYYMEYESRINDTFKLKFDYRYIEPSSDDPTVFNLLGKHQRVNVNLGYYF